MKESEEVGFDFLLVVTVEEDAEEDEPFVFSPSTI